MRQLDDTTYISGQVRPDDVPALKQQGITMIINNRPDGEEPDQPLAADIEAAAEAEGIAYRNVPIARGIGPSDCDKMQEALDAVGDGKALAFCRTGNRSALVWAVAKSEAGTPREDIEEKAAQAGIDLTPVAHLL